MRAFAHVTDLPYVKGHQGMWTFALPDGTLFLAVRHHDIGLAHHELSRHSAVKSVMPTRTNGGPADPALIAAVSAFLQAHPNASAAKPLNPGAKAADILNAVYAVTGDPAFHPEASP